MDLSIKLAIYTWIETARRVKIRRTTAWKGITIMPQTRLEKISAAAQIYGERSFDNYSQIRSIAEQLRTALCESLDPDQQCVFVVPPQGPFQAQNYGSAAFSVSGKGFLPLEPMSFGLAVKVSGDNDYMRLILTCRKEGDKMYIQIEDAGEHILDLPTTDDGITILLDKIYEYVLEWFTGRVDHYDNGSYGSNDIGFDIQRVET